MSDTPPPSPAPDAAPKPKLNLAPKAPAPADAPLPAASSPVLQAGLGSSNATPPSLSAPRPVSMRPGLKLQSTPHSAVPTDAPVPRAPAPVAAADGPSAGLFVLALISAAAALTFAVLLYLKDQQ